MSFDCASELMFMSSSKESEKETLASDDEAMKLILTPRFSPGSLSVARPGATLAQT